MKKNYIICFVFFLAAFAKSQCPTFTIGAPFGTVVGCNPTTVQLDALNTSTLTGVTYTWISASTGTQTGATINASCPGASNTFTVVASAPSNTCFSTQTITVSSNTTVPSVSVSPTTRTLTCNGGCVSFTAATSFTANLFGTWSNSGNTISTGPSVSPLVMCANAPGTYTATFTNAINGCSSSQTVAVVSNTAIPSMVVLSGSANLFTITCTNPTVPMYINTTSTLTPISYSWIPVANPSASTTPASGGYTTSVPGKYVAVMHDANFCYISNTVTVFIDTIRPAPFAKTNLTSNSFTLNCTTTSLIATAVSAPLMASSSYSWITPPNISVASNTISVSLANITSSVTPSTYTVLAMGANGCIRKSNVFFWKDTYVPPVSLVFTPNAITCTNTFVTMSPFSFTTVAINFTVTSPPPTQTTNFVAATFTTPGTYTLNYVNGLNGCAGITTTVVPFNAIPPATFAVGPYVIPCGTSSTNITAGTNSLNPSYTYSWTGPAGATMDNPTGYFTSADMAGTYTVLINNFSNGCSSYNFVSLSTTSVLSVPIIGLDTICLGYGTNISTIVSGATSYSWNTGATSNLIYVTPTITTVYSVAVTNSVTGCSGTKSFTVHVSSCVGIKEILWNGSVTISPNPNNGKFNLQISNYIENGEIKILNSIGQEVGKQKIKQGNNEINALDLAKGIYYYIITQNKELINNGKILIE